MSEEKTAIEIAEELRKMCEKKSIKSAHYANAARLMSGVVGNIKAAEG
jgi:hypothetical protein